MRFATTLIYAGLLATLLGGSALAGDHFDRTDRDASSAERMAAENAPWQAIDNPAEEGMPAHGWQYFYNPQAPRAVVISPDDHYYLSRGKGLHWVAAAQQVEPDSIAPWEAITNAAEAGMPGFGWRYFHEPASPRAVVISPDGHYYLSQGKGLYWVAAVQQLIDGEVSAVQ